MKSGLRISLVQADLAWEDVQRNLEKFDVLLKGLISTDLIILPEMFSTGFTMNTSVSESMDGPALTWMKSKASELKAHICGSISVKEADQNFNRMIVMSPDGSYQQYDKRHLFRMANEQDHYSAGNRKLIVDIMGWKICPLVCYDLRFPVWSRNRFDENGTADYDLLLYVANWPEKRRLPWNKLLPARGIENLSYVAGVNRVGSDGNGVAYSGDSALYDFAGVRMTNLEPFKEGVETVTLHKDHLLQFRRSFPAYRDADEFSIKE